MPISPDRIAGRFVIDAEHRSGGMGTVYRARDLLTGQPVAIKLLHGRTASETERFVREASALANLAHPAIVKYVAHGVLPGGAHYLAMEWLEGENLAERLAQGALSVADTLVLAGRIAGALAEAHRRGIVHRDIKPANIVLEGGSPARAKLLDFGVALAGLETQQSQPVTLPVGTPGYMAPEQARGQTQPGPAADVFALGCVLYECLAGRPAFASENLLGLLAKILVEEPRPLGERTPGIPVALELLLRRLLVKEAADRPPHGGAVVELLAELSSGASEAPAVLPLAGELRVVSLVLAHAGNGTPLPPEDLLRSAAAPFGARLELLADGSLLAVIAGGGAATDRAARAAQAALALRDVLPGRALCVATGRVSVRGDRPGALPAGDVIEQAAALAWGATAGTIFVDEATAPLLLPRFTLRELPPRRASEPPLRVLDGARSQEITRTLLGRPIACVGRDREIALLEETFRESREESVARAVLVTGGPGIGKSRLLAELLARVPDGALVIAGRGDAMAAGASFGLLAPAIRRAVGIHGGEPLELRQAKLAARVAASVRPGQANRVAAFVGELASVPFPDDENPPLRAARSDAMLMGDAMRTAWEEWLAAECRQRSVVIVLDDLHWGDLPTVRFVDAALRALVELPLFVLAMARSEVTETFPNLWRERSLQQLRLSPLTRRASQALVREVLGDDVDLPTAERVIERADGNPFFLEELLLTVASGRSNLPETVIGTVQARLDALAPAARRVLRAASVFGTTFSARGVAVLLGEDESDAIKEWLDDLVHREILVRRGQGGGVAELAFRHELVREAAYAMLPPEDRRQCHLTAAEWLEWLGETDAVVLGEHLERGGEITRAAAWYRRGAEQALGASDLQAAVDRAELGIALIPDGDPLGALLLVKAEALRWLGEPLSAERHATMALARLVPGTTPWFHAAGELLTASGRLGNLALVRETATQAAETPPFPGAVGERVICLCRAAEQLMAAGEQAAAEQILAAANAVPPTELDRLAQARMLRVLSRRDLFAGDVAGYVERQEQAVVALDDAGDHRGACSARSDLGLAYASLGDFRRAEVLLREALTSAEGRSLVHVAGWSQAHLAQVLPRVDDLGGARAAALRAIELAITHRDRRLEGTARMHLASVHLSESDPISAEKEARAAVDLLAISPPRRAAAYAVLARAQVAQGKIGPALDASSAATTILNDLGSLDEGEITVRLVQAETLSASGDHPAALAALRKAFDRLGELAKGIWEARLRDTYLHAVPDHARTLTLARDWNL